MNKTRIIDQFNGEKFAAHYGLATIDSYVGTDDSGVKWLYYPTSIPNDIDLSEYVVTAADRELVVDVATGNAISGCLHPLCGTDEQLGIIRDLLVQWGNALGLEFTTDFTRLNEIAITEIEKAKAVKDAQDY